MLTNGTSHETGRRVGGALSEGGRRRHAGGVSQRPGLTSGQAEVLEYLERTHPHGHHAGDVARHLGLPANRCRERLTEEAGLVGSTLANAGVRLSGAFVVNGSPTKSQMVNGAGGRSQLARLATSVVVVAALAFLIVRWPICPMRCSPPSRF
jgi:hypothetical protein